MRFLAMFVLCALAVAGGCSDPRFVIRTETFVNAVGDIMLAGSGVAFLKQKGL